MTAKQFNVLLLLLGLLLLSQIYLCVCMNQVQALSAQAAVNAQRAASDADDAEMHAGDAEDAAQKAYERTDTIAKHFGL